MKHAILSVLCYLFPSLTSLWFPYQKATKNSFSRTQIIGSGRRARRDSHRKFTYLDILGKSSPPPCLADVSRVREKDDEIRTFYPLNVLSFLLFPSASTTDTVDAQFSRMSPRENDAACGGGLAFSIFFLGEDFGLKRKRNAWDFHSASGNGRKISAPFFDWLFMALKSW